MSGAKCKTCEGTGTGELAWGAIGTCPDCWGCGTNHASLDKIPTPALQGRDYIPYEQLCRMHKTDLIEMLARERESRKQAEAALSAIIRIGEMYIEANAKPIPQEPAEPESGK